MKLDTLLKANSELTAGAHVPAPEGGRAAPPGGTHVPDRAPNQSSLDGLPPFQPQAARGPRAAAQRLRLRRDRKTTQGQLTRTAKLIKSRTRKKRS